MGRRILPLTPDLLDDLPSGCAGCLFWEFDPVHRGALHDDPQAHKAAWVENVLAAWGPPGLVLYLDRGDGPTYAGHLIYAPAIFLPGAQGFATAPVSPDACLLATGHVAIEERGGGLGKVMVQAMAKDLVKRHVRAVEAFGDTRSHHGQCVLPLDFLSSVGFAVQRAHATYPRLRMDLRGTVRWRAELSSGLGSAWKRLRPAHQPVPGMPTPGQTRTPAARDHAELPSAR